MNTSSFKSNVNVAACKMENDMRRICGLEETTPGGGGLLLTPEIQQRLERCKAVLASSGRPGTDPALVQQCKDLIQQYEPAYLTPSLQPEIDACNIIFAKDPYLHDAQGNVITDADGSSMEDPQLKEQKKYCTEFFQKNNLQIPGEGGTEEPTPGPVGLSFATHSIDGWDDLLNFFKASGVILLGTSMHPSMLMSAEIILGASLLYGLRNKIKNFFNLNHIQ